MVILHACFYKKRRKTKNYVRKLNFLGFITVKFNPVLYSFYQLKTFTKERIFHWPRNIFIELNSVKAVFFKIQEVKYCIIFMDN